MPVLACKPFGAPLCFHMALHLYRCGESPAEIAFRVGTSERWVPYYLRAACHLSEAERLKNRREEQAFETRRIAAEAAAAERQRDKAEQQRKRRLAIWYMHRRLNGIGRPLDMAGPRGVWLEYRIGDRL